LRRVSITSWNACSSVWTRNQSSQLCGISTAHARIEAHAAHVKALPATKQHRISSDPIMPTTPRQKNVLCECQRGCFTWEQRHSQSNAERQEIIVIHEVLLLCPLQAFTSNADPSQRSPMQQTRTTHKPSTAPITMDNAIWYNTIS
jgi:hypothetical protein